MLKLYSIQLLYYCNNVLCIYVYHDPQCICALNNTLTNNRRRRDWLETGKLSIASNQGFLLALFNIIVRSSCLTFQQIWPVNHVRNITCDMQVESQNCAQERETQSFGVGWLIELAVGRNMQFTGAYTPLLEICITFSPT